MHLSFAQQSPAEATVTVRIAPEDYQSPLQAEVKEYSKKVRIKGFRQGNSDIIKQRYGRELLQKVVHEQAHKQLADYAQQQKLELIGAPRLKEEATTWAEGATFSLHYELDLIPPFSVDLSPATTVALYEPLPLTEEEVDAEVILLRDAYKTYTPGEVSGPATTLYGKLQQENPDVAPLPLRIAISRAPNASYQPLLGHPKGASIPFPAEVLQPNLATLPTAFQEAVSSNTPLLFQIEEVQVHVPAPLEQDFFDKVVGKGKANDLASFKAALYPTLERISKEAAQKLSKEAVREVLVAQTTIPLPTKYQAQKEATTWSLIVDKLSKEYDVAVSSEEIIADVKNTFRTLFLKHGGKEPEEQQLLHHTLNFLQKDKGASYEKVAQRRCEEKIYELILSKVTPQKTPITYTELKERGAL